MLFMWLRLKAKRVMVINGLLVMINHAVKRHVPWSRPLISGFFFLFSVAAGTCPSQTVLSAAFSSLHAPPHAARYH